MAEIPHLPLFIDDYEAATAHLTLEEDGAYNRLLRLQWRTPGCKLPDDFRWIQRRLRVDEETFARVVEPLIEEFFSRSHGKLFQKRLFQEFEHVSSKISARKEAGKKGAAAKHQKTNETEGGKGSDLPEAKAKQTADKPLANAKQTSGTHIHIHTHYTDSADALSAAGASEQDLVDHIWKAGVPLLVGRGTTEKSARSVIGMWLKHHKPQIVDQALQSLEKSSTKDPVPYVNAILQQQGSTLLEDFERFWAAYPDGPNKTDKPIAQRAFTLAVTGRAKGIPKTDAETIIKAAKAMSRADAKFHPAPARWLEGARWAGSGPGTNGSAHPYADHPVLSQLNPASPTFQQSVDAYFSTKPDEEREWHERRQKARAG